MCAPRKACRIGIREEEKVGVGLLDSDSRSYWRPSGQNRGQGRGGEGREACERVCVSVLPCHSRSLV